MQAFVMMEDLGIIVPGILKEQMWELSNSMLLVREGLSGRGGISYTYALPQD